MCVILFVAHGSAASSPMHVGGPLAHESVREVAGRRPDPVDHAQVEEHERQQRDHALGEDLVPVAVELDVGGVLHQLGGPEVQDGAVIFELEAELKESWSLQTHADQDHEQDELERRVAAAARTRKATREWHTSYNEALVTPRD